jgi:hypothetical protein
MFRQKLLVWLGVAVLGLLFMGPGTAVAAPIDFTIWNFDDGTSNPSTDITNNAVAAAGSGLSNENFLQGNPTTGLSWSFTNWALDPSAPGYSGTGVIDTTKYFEFKVDLSNYGGIVFSFDERRSGTGIRDFIVHYSIDGVTFSPIPATQTTVADNTSWRSHSFDLGSGTPIDLAIRGESDVYFRIYGYNAEGTGGTWRIDNVTFTASTNPTAITLQSLTAVTAASPIFLIVALLVGIAAAGTAVVISRRTA